MDRIAKRRADLATAGFIEPMSSRQVAERALPARIPLHPSTGRNTHSDVAFGLAGMTAHAVVHPEVSWPPVLRCLPATVPFFGTCVRWGEHVLEADAIGDEEERLLRNHLLVPHVTTLQPTRARCSLSISSSSLADCTRFERRAEPAPSGTPPHPQEPVTRV